MLLTLQLITHVVDRQRVSRVLLHVLQMLDYDQLPVSIFLTLPSGSVVQLKLSENHINISKEIPP